MWTVLPIVCLAFGQLPPASREIVGAAVAWRTTLPWSDQKKPAYVYVNDENHWVRLDGGNVSTTAEIVPACVDHGCLLLLVDVTGRKSALCVLDACDHCRHECREVFSGDYILGATKRATRTQPNRNGRPQSGVLFPIPPIMSSAV